MVTLIVMSLFYIKSIIKYCQRTRVFSLQPQPLFFLVIATVLKVPGGLGNLYLVHFV